MYYKIGYMFVLLLTQTPTIMKNQEQIERIAPLVEFIYSPDFPDFVDDMKKVMGIVLCSAETLDTEELCALYKLHQFTCAIEKIKPEN